jgi:prepilin signal peptidase PulO-like enzyme (type II secretory pathway)
MKLYYFGFRTFIISLVSGLILFIFIMIVKLLGDKAFKQESIGGGDIKLITMFGFVFGVRLALVSLVVGSFLAFPYALYCSIKKSNREIPFGPFLITALLFVFIFMEPIKNMLNLLIFW